MTAILPWLVLASPVALCLAAARDPNEPRRYADIAIITAAAALAVAVIAAIAVMANGPIISATVGLAEIGISVYVDALSAVMLLLVSFVGLIVTRYSRNYLDGDPGHERFTRWLLLALASVLALILSGNLAVLILAWIATSLSLNKLLLFYGERPAAQRAAAKKFVASRVGDVCLIVAAGILYAHFGTLDIPSLLAAAKNTAVGEAASFSITVAALLIVVTALLKSAQLPLHGWLIEVMETPTPVSALLHAGIINAGGFLVLRLADVLLLASPALEVLAVIGGATALFGSLVMLTQTSIKVQLAYSTVAQMGFMLLQCGLGAFSSALLHIVAHSLYKAHAFLSSGSVMDLARASWTPSPGGQPHPARLVMALVAVLGITFAIALLFGVSPTNNPGQIALGAVLLMGLVHLMANAIDERPNAYVLISSGAIAVAVAVAYFALQAGMAWLVAGSVPAGHVFVAPVDIAIATLVVVSFAAVTLFQNQMARHSDQPFWAAAYVHLRHGLYLNTVANRLVLQLWPRWRKAATQQSATSP
jgi:NAD(P)H-quinone oxidoreductase subunit 5